ncbi:carbamoyltransferase HypF [Nonomuraea aurantiaca]|uniref:carbamoyltransferase HypF n=1 Tax=Nonomuraea aurantiaca TaxID=2878562 RepID=UPI001CD9995A|nr:carbamoyltransferase HypF [Nonomuraea aurantiaca]MCA2228897.1 carbamoyltransferase HypF [Nonomuraea aurantiaca]
MRSRIRVEGIVQGVGFRPFVHGLAVRYGLSGTVGNDGFGVFIEVEGPAGAVSALVEAVSRNAPALAAVDRVSVESVPPTGPRGFRIVPSMIGGAPRAHVSPDAATCDDCLAELFDPADRRYRYPFVNCTNCGPRFTIITAVPYDRAATTMRAFSMCTACAAEYRDPRDRRFHAQPVCCPACGPTLVLHASDGAMIAGDPVSEAAALLRAGSILAVKGLGGHHLAVDATDEDAVAALRARKHRGDKAFAVMAPDLAAVRELCELDGEASGVVAALTGARRPIVLLPRRAGSPIAVSVAPGNRDLGVLLPYTPLHHLLARELGRPFVLTSGNLSGEPIAHRDEDARRLAADAFLTHDRPIHAGLDDSVVRIFRDTEVPVRRARGHAPAPIALPWAFPRPVLACGAQLKSTFCLATGSHAFVSQHLGDLENYATMQAFAGGVAHFRRLFGIEPEVVAYDLHPEYLSTKYALTLDGVQPIGVQHHHAHIASCLADNGEPGPVVGVALDGTGYGTDGTIWGGELLVADLVGFERAGHLEPVPMPGGVTAIRQPWRMAAAFLHSAYGAENFDDLDVVRRNQDRWPAVAALVANGPAELVTSSAGRLFDAVSALLGIRDTITYDGQAAVELEQRADPGVRGGYPVAVAGTVIRGTDLIRAVVGDLRRGEASEVIAARFHHGLAEAVVTATTRVAAANGLEVAALSGGVFCNTLLLGAVVDGLRRHGLRVLLHRRVPCNDGGISLGQAVVAGARDRAAR